MPMTTTHALVPLAAALAFAKRPTASWRLLIAASIAAAAPDIDAVFKHLVYLPDGSIYLHRGATHSLFVALFAGLLAAVLHNTLRVPPLTAGVAVTGSMASHGLLDMMAQPGMPVAYLWPLSSARLMADWRPIHSLPVHRAHLLTDALIRFELELREIILPMLATALVVRIGLSAIRRAVKSRSLRKRLREQKGARLIRH
jgi:inner membrane protein